MPSARDQAAQLRPGTSCRPSRVSGLTCSKFSRRSRSTSCSRASSALTSGRAGRFFELRLQHGPQRALAVVAHAGGEAVEAVGAVAFFDDEAGVLQQAEVARDARLGQAENAGQFLDVETVLVEHAQQAQPGLVAEQPVERGRLFHIY